MTFILFLSKYFYISFLHYLFIILSYNLPFLHSDSILLQYPHTNLFHIFLFSILIFINHSFPNNTIFQIFKTPFTLHNFIIYCLLFYHHIHIQLLFQLFKIVLLYFVNIFHKYHSLYHFVLSIFVHNYHCISHCLPLFLFSNLFYFLFPILHQYYSLSSLHIP